jgi:hypothetical protein
MTRFIRMVLLAGILAICSVAGFLAFNSSVAKSAFAEAGPAPCTCSALTRLQYTPAAPTEPLVRIYVGQCQCGAMSCAVTTGALQCVK